MKVANTALFLVYQFYFHCRQSPISASPTHFASYLFKTKKPRHTKNPTHAKQTAFAAFPIEAQNCFTGIYKVSLTTPAIWLLKEALDMWLEPHYLPFHALVLPKLLLGTFKFQTVAQICLCKNWHIHDLFSRDLFLNIFLFKTELLNFIILVFLFPHDSKEND